MGLLPPDLSHFVAVWTRVVQVSLRMYTQMLCHIPCEFLVLIYQHEKARKTLCSRGLEKPSGFAWSLVHGALRPCSGGRRR